ncbi:monovalent cation/H+ antiporter subunit D [Allohahella sp. A8]|uniref:monovalent cation/H+ antiporter subunit D n=1 Tax=Allohahella sp. A8 TaxID=3141461 RepID=UPI0026BEFD57|tara:strand:- start:13023 stop:14549 length:1527 start_codon:yes stop_codon:yes gene_type:complete
MQHGAILPILIPLIVGILLILPAMHKSVWRQRCASLIASASVLMISIWLLIQASTGEITIYALGDWQPPYGIILVLDRLSALMLVLTSLLGFSAILYACHSDDTTGSFFHVLMQFQLMGLNGAFLTGDLFNLFVFFEILLIASYALVIHGGGKQKTRANVHYVILNLVGSSLFLFALGILYGTLGTLNMADMASKVATVPAEDQSLVEAGALLLLVVFGLKAAAFPLYFWLPRTYAAAVAPVAALFAIMTKVGIYSMLRVFTLVFGEDAGALSNLAIFWLWPAAVITIFAGAVGVMAAQDMRTQIAYLVVVSIGTLLGAMALNSEDATAALLYYLIHTTMVSAGLFLLVDLIARQRGQAGDRIVGTHPLAQPLLLGGMFFLGAIAIVGMPPFSGFIGKALLLKATMGVTDKLWLWPPLLLSSLMVLIALSRTGTTVFWRVSKGATKAEPAAPGKVVATLLLLSAAPLLAIFGGSVAEYTAATAAQLHAPGDLVRQILPGVSAAGGVRP